jgi:UDP-N-acetylglucosamine acyltransferase
VTVGGHPAKPHGINSEGLRRRGFSDDAISAIKRAYRAVYVAGLKLDDALERVQALAAEVPEVAALASFVADSNRSIVR